MHLTIIITHYNISQLLEQLLYSIPQNKNIQTIIIDNNSTSAHLNAIKKLLGKFKFELYQNDKMNTPGLSKNIALEKAKGKWILFADSDDYFVNGFYDIIKSYFDTKSDLVFFSPVSKHINTEISAKRHLNFQRMIKNYLVQKNKKNELFLRFNFMPTWSKMIKKNFLDNHSIRFNESKYTCGDVMFSTKVGYFVKYFDVSEQSIYYVIARSGSMSTALNEEWFDMRVQERISRITFLKENLSKNEMKIMSDFLCIIAAQLLFFSFRKFGMKKFLSIYKLYLKNNITWFTKKYLNPFEIIKYIF
jgi:glycosyltransferase involved in cell wall biosynthesis